MNSLDLVPHIYIYSGETILNEKQCAISYEGVSSVGVCNLKSLLQEYYPHSQIKLVESDQVQPDTWSKSSLFVLPGGRCRLWKWIHDSDKVKKIQSFVNRGGSLLAFCAGAYGCCQHYQFKESNGEILEKKLGLDFFPGSGIGPLIEENQPIPSTRLKATAVQIKWESTAEKGYVMLNGGGYFSSEKKEDFQVIARYVDVPDECSLAIVKCKKGKGVVVLSFVHPEYTADNYPVDLLKSAIKKDDSQETLQKTQLFDEIYLNLKRDQSFQKKCLEQMLQEFNK